MATFGTKNVHSAVAGTNLQLENRHDDKKDQICYNIFLQTNYSNLINVRSFAKSPSVLPFLKSHYELVVGRVLSGIRVLELNIIEKGLLIFFLPNIFSILNLTIFQTGARQRCFKT